MATSDRLEPGELSRSSGELSSRTSSRALFGLTVATFALASGWLAANLNLYIDELYSLHTTGSGFAYALQQSLGFEQQPPLFFLALTAWRTLSTSDFFARLFSICCSIATLFVVRSFSRRRLAAIPDWVAPFAVAINPFFLWAALDIRVYALIVTISAILIATFFDAFTDEAISLPKLAAFTVTAIAALYTQYFIGSLFLGFGLTLLLSGPRRKFVPFVLSMVVVAIACLPLFAILRHEFHDATVVNAGHPLALAGRMLTATVSFVYPHFWIGSVSKFLNIPYIALVLFTLAVIARELRRDATLQRLVTIAACIVGFFLLVIVVLRTPLEMPRHISTLFAPIVLLAIAAAAALPKPEIRARALAAYLVLLAAFSAADDVPGFRPPISNTGDWQRVGELLTAHAKASEPIAVFDTEDVLAVRHYYRGPSAVVPLPRAQRFDVFDRRAFAIRSPAELAAAFPAASPQTHRVWFVYGFSGCSIVEIGNSCAILNAYVDAHFRVLQERRFNGTVVEELEAKEPLRGAASRHETYGSFGTTGSRIASMRAKIAGVTSRSAAAAF